MTVAEFLIRVLPGAVGAVSGITALVMNVRYQRWSKRVDITNTFLARFEGLARDMALVSKGDLQELDFWRRFWHLQQEQFVLWRKGLVDDDLYRIWMNYRREEWKENSTLQERSYRQSFEAVASALLPEFREFLTRVVFSEQQPFKDFKRAKTPGLRRLRVAGRRSRQAE